MDAPVQAGTITNWKWWLRICRRPMRAIAAAAGLGIAAAWIGVLLAYDSYAWPPRHQGWPVSFFVVSLVLAAYLLAQLTGRRARQGQAQ